MRVRFAVSAAARMRGMLGAGVEEALLIAPCHRIHTIGMRYALDVAYIAADGRVLRTIRQLPPGRLPPGCPEAVAVLERRTCEDDWFAPGQFIGLKSLQERGLS